MDIFRIRFRVSKRLIPFFTKTYISKSLQTKNRKNAKLKLNYIYYKYRQLLDASYILPNDLLQETAVYFDMLEKVKLAFDEKGISIPYPQMDIHTDKEK